MFGPQWKRRDYEPSASERRSIPVCARTHWPGWCVRRLPGSLDRDQRGTRLRSSRHAQGRAPTPGVRADAQTRAWARADLDATWATQPLALVQHEGRACLVLDDPGGELLARRLGTPMELGLFLRVGVGLAAALGALHRKGIIHKDLTPGHVIIDEATGHVRLTGLGIASRLRRERQTPEPPEVIAGTLPYMAPEQTGRMNRSIDSRSDLYALGVILYEMLTGALPFTASDPMEWVHCHIARQPLAPTERVQRVPRALSAIIMRLLAKTAEQRYQTAAGVERDLRRCLTQWQAEHRIDDFPVGRQDTPDQLSIPERLMAGSGRSRLSWPRSIGSSGSARRSWSSCPVTPASANRRSSTNCTRHSSRPGVGSRLASSIRANATCRTRRSRRRFRISSWACSSRASPRWPSGARRSKQRWARMDSW